MAGKTHPIITVFLILGGVVLFLGAVIALVMFIFSPNASLKFGEKIGVITIEEQIVSSRHITRQLAEFAKDRGIRAVLLRIDSPGGAVGPTQEIYREIRKTAQEKNVVVSLGSVAASGGYYIAAAADKIVANPGTITGSIGVLMHFVRLEDLLEKLGIRMNVLKSGEFKDIGSPHREMTDRERELLMAMIEEIKGQFIAAVAEGRRMSLEEVRDIADGRIMSGAKAKELGLVDRLGNFEDAVKLAEQLAGVKDEATLVYPRKLRPGFWDTFFEASARALRRAVPATGHLLEYRWDGIPDPAATGNY